METSPFRPPGGRVIRCSSPHFETPIDGPLTGEAARPEFNRSWPLLEAAILAYAPTHERLHVWAKIESSDAQLWTTPEAALVTEIRIWPTGMREAIGWLAGGDIDDLLSMRPAFEAWARSKRCKRVGILLGREGWSRKLDGYRTAGVQMMKEL